jgi:ADP-heptose:LPS heptosyltransferase
VGPAPEQERIIVSRLRFLGDVVLSTPLLEVLRQVRPDAWIDYVTYPAHAPVLKHHPGVNRILTIPSHANPIETVRLARQLRRPRAAWFFDLLSNPRSALHVALARPRVSVGQKTGIRSVVYSHGRPRPLARESQVMGHLDKLVPMLGAVGPRLPRVYVTDAERDGAIRRFSPGDARPTVVIHPGATWPWRLWPLDRWSELIHALLAARSDLRTLVVTPPGDSGPVLPDLPASPRLVVLPQLSLRELMAVLATATAYVGNDGGVLHTAVALGVPTVGLFGGENDPGAWFPYEDLGPFRAVLQSSTETLAAAGGRRYPRPDASVAQVSAALETVWPALGTGPATAPASG